VHAGGWIVDGGLVAEIGLETWFVMVQHTFHDEAKFDEDT
jgi:hypothetical protein